MILCLLGMTATGKTSIGRAIARLLKCQFIDLDERIERKVDMSVRSFYAKCGRQEFQKKECDVLKEVILYRTECDDASCCVISVGGGLIENQGAIEFLSCMCTGEVQNFRLFFLDVPSKILWNRLLKKAKNQNTFPAFLKPKLIASEASSVSNSSKKIEICRLYRTRFLALYRRRMLLFRNLQGNICISKIKCKGKKVKQIAKLVINKL